MLIGVFLGSVYRKLKELRDQEPVNIGAVVKAAVKSTDFWLGLFASPVVYVILLQAINLERVSLPGFIGITLVGLQNGFVCSIMAEALIGPKHTTTRRAAK